VSVDTKIKKIAKDLLKDTAVFIQGRVAAQLLADVKLRVSSKGINANNIEFSRYSTRPLKIYYSEYAINKAVYNKLAKAKATNWVTDEDGKKAIVLEGGYKQAREIAGYQTKHKSFLVTGQMWRGVKNRPIQTTTDKIIIAWGSTDERTEQLTNRHSKREGINILLPSKEELEDVRKQLVTFVEQYIKRNV